MLKRHSISVIIAIALFAPVTVFAIVNWMEKKWSALPVLKAGTDIIRDFHLTNQHGKVVSFKDWKEKIVVADFFFTHCPSICPKMANGLKKVQSSFPTDKNLLFNSFSVDPARDSVGRLKAYAEQFRIEHNWNLLTGSKEEIYRLARNSFAITATKGDGGANDFIHSEKLVLIDGLQRIRGYYNGTSDKDIQTLINDIQKLHDEK